VCNEATGGHGADIVYNTVGCRYFEASCRAMAIRGRQILSLTIERPVPFDAVDAYQAVLAGVPERVVINPRS
jgi:NADPH2:quinone reductase